MEMNIAVVYIAEAYQCYHGAAIALELANRPGVRVVSYYNDPQTPAELARIRAAYAEFSTHDDRPLRRSAATRLLQRLRFIGMFKELVMRDNVAELDGYDAIFVVEDTFAAARRVGITQPRLIYMPHGAGDRARGFARFVAKFDFVLLSGPKLAARMLNEGLIRPGGYAMPGLPKLETCARIAASEAAGRAALFAQPRPIVLYNAHKAPGLSSWARCLAPMLRQFASQHDLNLIVAPHVKLFRRRRAAVRARWNARSTGSILIDTGSDRCLDMSYTAAADIYVGDVSAQVYEFLVTPRPCVFLNPYRIDWRADPSFAHWQLGDVVEDPARMMDAIRAAPGRHHLYRARQEAMAADSLGDRSAGIAERGADAILRFMATG